MSAAADSPASFVLSTWEAQVAAAVAAAVEDVGTALPYLGACVAGMTIGNVPYRLLPMAVLGALTGDPQPAVPVCVVSQLWWAGAEALDDLTDSGGLSGGADRSVAESLIGGVACLTLLPHAVVERSPLAADVRQDWIRELNHANLDAAEGQLTDLEPDDGGFSWAQVITSYRGKTGAPYARDAVMAARLATAEEEALRGWRAFGWLFGLLRQLHNDAASAASAQDEDLANGTRVLQLAHALEVCPAAARAELRNLREMARTDRAARAELRRRLSQPAFADGYTARIRGMSRRACQLLDELAPASHYRDLLHVLVHASASGAEGGGRAQPADCAAVR